MDGQRPSDMELGRGFLGASQQEEWLDSAAIFSALKRSLRLIAVLWVLLSVVVTARMFSSEPQFTAQLLLYPVSTQSASSQIVGLGSGGLASLAEMAGLGSGSTQMASPFDLFQQTLYSRAVANDLASKPDFLRHIYYYEWDSQVGRFVPPGGLVGMVKAGLAFASGQPAWLPPSGERLQRDIAGRVSISEIGKTGVYRLTFTDRSPEFAARFLDAIRATSDSIVREQALSRNAKFASYLRKRLQDISVEGYRNAIVMILGNVEQTIMVAQSTTGYSAELLDGPSVASRPSWPNMVTTPLLAIGISLFLSLGVGLGWGMFGHVVLEKMRRR